MPGFVADRRLFTPATVREALRMLDGEGPLTPLAGCTDLYVALNFGTLNDSKFLNLWNLDDLRRIEVRGTVLSIGALCTYTQIIESRHVRARLPMLVAASKEIGGPQIQNRGTIGGNVANASPAGDTLPVLAAADAMLLLKSAGAERRVPFAEFYTGYRRSVLRANELIAAVEVPAVKGRQWFRKVGTRAAQAISKVVMAGIDPGRGGAPRLGVGSVAATVVRLPSTEAALASGASIADAQRILLDEIAPIDDVRSTAEYRRRVAANLLADFWRKRSRR